jgi:hypothetical protein
VKAQKDALFFALGLLVGIVVAHSMVASRSVTRSQVEENGFRLVRERIGFATKAHRKAIQEYVRHYRAAYRDDLNIEGADENAREEMDERGTVMNDDKFALVVSVYKEWGENNEKVPEWANANASRDNYFVVQPFYQRIEASKPAFVVNKGFESGVYMRYIVDNYHNLPEAVIFVQADGCEVDMNAVLPRVTLEILDQAGGFLPLNCLKVMGRSISMWGGEKGERVEACWREVSKHFELNLFEGFALGSDFQINMVCCACFAVKRELLLSTPFEVWNSFYERSIVKGQCIEGQLDIDEGKHETAGTFEHLAHVIFGRKDRLWEPKCFDDFAIIVNNEDAPGSLKQSEVHATDRVEKQPVTTVENADGSWSKLPELVKRLQCNDVSELKSTLPILKIFVLEDAPALGHFQMSVVSFFCWLMNQVEDADNITRQTGSLQLYVSTIVNTDTELQNVADVYYKPFIQSIISYAEKNFDIQFSTLNVKDWYDGLHINPDRISCYDDDKTVRAEEIEVYHRSCSDRKYKGHCAAWFDKLSNVDHFRDFLEQSLDLKEILGEVANEIIDATRILIFDRAAGYAKSYQDANLVVKAIQDECKQCNVTYFQDDARRGGAKSFEWNCRLIASYDIIIAAHGAFLSNLPCAKPNSALIEIIWRDITDMSMYEPLAHQMGLKYRRVNFDCVICEAADPEYHPVKPDLAELRSALQSLTEVTTELTGNYTKVKVNEPVVQNTIDRIEKWQPKYSPEKAEQCLAQKYKGVQNGSMAQSSTNILVYGNSVSRRFYQLLSAYLLSISGTEEDALAAQEHRLMTRQEEKVECNKELPGISCSTEIIYQKVNLGQRKIVVYFHFEQRIYSKNLEAVINETAPQIVIGNAGLDNYFCQHALHDEPRCGEDKSLSSIQNSLEGSAEWEEQIKTWKLNLVERADKLAELVNSGKSKFGTKFVWRKSTCMCTKWNSMPSSIDHSKHNETLLNWFLNTSDSIVQERLKLDSNNILDASDLTRLNTEPYAKVCELYEDHVHPKRRIHDILIDNMLVLLCSAEPKGNLEENRVDVTVNSQKAKENTTETLPEAFRLLSNKLMKNQYRDSCTAACFYSTKFSPNSGLGSRLQFIVAALTFAIEDGCVLIASPDSSLQLFGGSSLKELTNCKDEDAKDIKYIDSGASDMDENGLLARYMRYVPQFDDLGLKGSIMLWQSVALSFLMRATESFANIIQEVQNEIGWYDIQKCRGAVISMHVRHGDKGTETSLLPLSAYLKELALWLENAEQNQEFKCIFVATDDGDLQKRLEDSPVLELESGRKFKVIGSWQSNVAAQKLSSSEGEFGALLDLHLLSRAKTFCFTFSSNFGRLAMHMNPVHLEARAVSSLIPMDYYHHAISSGFFFVRQQNVRRGSWSTVAVFKEKISSTLNCEPQYGCSAQTFDSSQNETYSCCRLPAKSDYVNGVIGPVLSEIFPDEYEKYCRVIDDY